MQVILKRKWFVGGNRYVSVGKYPVEIPDKYKDSLPKGALIVGESEDAPETVPAEDAPGTVPAEDAPGTVPYVNPAHALDSKRQFAEALSVKNAEAKSEVDSFRDKLKNSK